MKKLTRKEMKNLKGGVDDIVTCICAVAPCPANSNCGVCPQRCPPGDNVVLMCPASTPFPSDCEAPF